MNFKKLKDDLTIWGRSQKPVLRLTDIYSKMGYSVSSRYVQHILNGKNKPSTNFWLMLEHVTGLKEADYTGESK